MHLRYPTFAIMLYFVLVMPTIGYIVEVPLPSGILINLDLRTVAAIPPSKIFGNLCGVKAMG